MKIIIVGAGIAGLTLALALAHSSHRHHIIILESAPQLAEIGAGIQMTPQAIKHWFAWGLKDDLLKNSIIPPLWHVRNGKTGEVIGSVDVEHMETEYCAPYLVVHRAVLHEILHRHAVKAGVEVRVNSRVTRYLFEEAAVELASGEVVKGDLVVAADGINSFARGQLLGEEDLKARPTGWAAYRLTCDKSDIAANPLTRGLVEGLDSNLWVGEGRLLMTYLVKDAKVLNMVAGHKDDVDTSKWTEEQYAEEVGRLFEGFEPRVLELLRMASKKITNWPVYEVPPLKTWKHEKGKFVLVGDASHAMAFYLSLGVSLACEDGVALAKALELACQDLEKPSAAELIAALEVFERVRKPRAEAVQKASLHAGDVLQMENGSGQDVRDQALRRNEEGDGWLKADDRRYVYGVADKRTRDWCYGYDAAGAVREEWERRKTS